MEEVCRLLEEIKEWDHLGANLGLSETTIADIRRRSDGIDARTTAMISKWLESDGEATWEKLARALTTLGHDDIASQIRGRLTVISPPSNGQYLAFHSVQINLAINQGHRQSLPEHLLFSPGKKFFFFPTQ